MYREKPNRKQCHRGQGEKGQMSKTPRVTPGVRHDHKLEAAPGSGLWGGIKRLHIKTVEEGMERSMGNEHS